MSKQRYERNNTGNGCKKDCFMSLLMYTVSKDSPWSSLINKVPKPLQLMIIQYEKSKQNAQSHRHSMPTTISILYLPNGSCLGETSLGSSATATDQACLTWLLLEHLPELERLVSGSCGKHLAVW